MEDSLCRVSIAWSGAMTDLVLPRGMPLAALLPDIVELVAGAGQDITRSWQLSSLRGGRWEEDMTLRELGIHDGDVLAMSGSAAPVFVGAPRGEFRTVGAADGPRREQPASEAWAWCGAVSAATLVGSAAVAGRPVLAAVIAGLTVVVCAGAAVRAPTRRARTAASVVAVVFSAVAGHFVTGVASHPPGFLLGACAAALSAVLFIRLASADTALLTALATFATLVAVAVVVAVIAPAGLGTVAAVLLLTALGTLGAAARLVIVLTGLAPAMPDHRDRRISERRAAYGRAVLAGIVTGCAAAAGSGTVLMAVAGVQTGTVGAAGSLLTAAVTGTLLLRSRLYADIWCRIPLVVGGLVGAAAGSVLLMLWVPMYAGWITVTVAGVVGAMYGRRHAFSPSVARGVDVLEYLLLVATVPLAGWATGVFGIGRGLNVPW